MLVRASNLRVGDIIQETRGKRTNRTRVETIRRGGHVPHRYKTREGPTTPIAVSPTPTRLQPYTPVVINEEWVYPWTAWVTVLRGKEVHQVAEAASDEQAA